MDRDPHAEVDAALGLDQEELRQRAEDDRQARERAHEPGRQEQPWPAPLAPEAFHGIAGEIVRTIEPETEADPAALLFQLLAAVGNMLGAGACIRVEGDRHPPRLFVVQVGRTSKGRKGTSWGRVRRPAGARRRGVGRGPRRLRALLRRGRDPRGPRPGRQRQTDKKRRDGRGGRRPRRRRQAAAAVRGRVRQGAAQHGAAGQHALGRAARRLGPRRPAHPDQEQARTAPPAPTSR